MPEIDYSQPILGAGASAQTDFAAAQARTGLNFQGGARFKRGFKAELGVEAFADASAELSKFIHGSIEGTAFARAKAGIQLQLPLNLFKEFGFSARAEAIAEAAAGLQADLGISIGDFVLLAQRDQELIGLPLELLLLFLEEVSIGGAFEVNVSASAKAHASISVAGRVIEKAGEKAGFFYTIDAGVGLAAGVGMGLKAGAEFKDFRRFYGRAVDKSVDATIREIVKLLPASANQVIPILQTFGPVAKIALRIAYDVGQKIADNNPGASRRDMNTLCNEAVKTILEECQRFIFHNMLEGALAAIRRTLEDQVPLIGQATWDAAMTERRHLADRLMVMPEEPFQPTPKNMDYWKSVISTTAALLSKLYRNTAPDPRLVEAVTILYCASELLFEAVRSKVNKASAYAMAIGAGTVTADTRPFQGTLASQPIPVIKTAINAALGASGNRDLSYADLLQFLADDLVVNRVLTSVPQAAQFMKLFTQDLGRAENEIMKLFLQNAGSFVPAADGSGAMDPRETLRVIVNALDRFITDKFRTEALPAILDHVSDVNTRLYIEEVLFEAVLYVKDVALHSVLSWEGKTFGNDEFTEALAGVMTLLLGRTVVIVADTFLTATQDKIGESCAAIADKIRSGHDDVRLLNLPADPDVIRLTAECVQIGGTVLGPLPAETRGRIRRLLYQVFEPLPPDGRHEFFESLADDFFIPNEQQLKELTHELVALSQARFALFAEKFVLAVGSYILEELEDLLLQAIELLLNWEGNLANSLEDLAVRLRNLDSELTRLNNQVITLFLSADTALRQFFDVLSGPSLKTEIKAALKDVFVEKALGVLEDNDLYKALPRELRRGVRQNLNAAVDGLMNHPIVDPVLNAVRQIGDTLEELLLDCRELDPEENLPEQVMLLVLDKIEDHIREHFGGAKPHLDIGVEFQYRDLVGRLRTMRIPLGRIEVNLNPFLNVVRDTIEALDFYHDKLNAACFRLAQALAKELEAAAAELRKHETQKDHRRLATLAAEHEPAPREIAILNPTTLSNHSSAVDVKIHLGGVPLSFLGLEQDELQRVLIYLNGTLVPIKSLLVEGASTITNPKDHVSDFHIGRSQSFNAETGILTNGAASLVIDTARQYPAHATNTRKKNEGVRFAFSASEYREQPIAKTIAAPAGKKDGKAPFLGVNVKTDHHGRPVKEYAIHNNLPGRGNAASRINDFLNDQMAGLLLRFRVELDDFTEGVNVLTVVVLEKGGTRHQQTVSFTVTKATRRKPVGTLPGLPTGRELITLKPRGVASKNKKQPKKAVTVNLTQKQTGTSGPTTETKTVNTLLPIGSKSLAQRKQDALKYLQDQDKLNFVSNPHSFE